MTLTIRDAIESEYDQMLELTYSAYAEYQPHSKPDFWKQYQVNIANAVRDGSDIERICAFSSEGQMVGSVLLCAKSMTSDNPEIRLLAVHPDFRKLGIARHLMDECERRLTERGIRKVVLHTTSLMETARQMYERSGYIRSEENDFYPVPDFVVMGYEKVLPELPVVACP